MTTFREITRNRIDDDLPSGLLVVCRDPITHEDGHVITWIGEAGDRNHIVYPVWGRPAKTDGRYLEESGDGDAISMKKLG